MVFSDFAFIFRVLPIFMTIDFALKKDCSLCKLSLIAISFIFYYYVIQNTLCTLLTYAILNYIFIHILFIHNSRRGGYDNCKEIILTVGVILNFSGLCYYKYSVCLSSLIPFNLTSSPDLNLGILFFILLAISILVDIHTNRIKQKLSVPLFLICFFIFIQLALEPIAHFKYVREKLKQRNNYLSKVSYSLCV